MENRVFNKTCLIKFGCFFVFIDKTINFVANYNRTTNLEFANNLKLKLKK